MSSLEVLIYDIPHSSQRYPTCGDWYSRPSAVEGDDKQILFVKVSNLQDRREMWLVAIHELIEAALAEVAGITAQQVDDFDIAFEAKYRPRGPDGEFGRIFNADLEPGDDPECPVYRQHQIATGIERMLAAEMGVDWLTYERHIQELDSPPPTKVAEPPSRDLIDDIPF